MHSLAYDSLCVSHSIEGFIEIDKHVHRHWKIVVGRIIGIFGQEMCFVSTADIIYDIYIIFECIVMGRVGVVL